MYACWTHPVKFVNVYTICEVLFHPTFAMKRKGNPGGGFPSLHVHVLAYWHMVDSGLGECCFSVDGRGVIADMHLVFTYMQIREVLSFFVMGRERQPKGRDGFPGQWTPWVCSGCICMFVHALHNQCKKHLSIPLICTCTYSDVPGTDVRIRCTCTCTCIVLYPSVMTPLPTSTITTLTNPHTHVVAYMNSGKLSRGTIFTSDLYTGHKNKPLK